MNSYEIWLTDPAGGGVVEFEGGIFVAHKNLEQIGVISVNKRPFNPGELRVTQAALDQLGESGVMKAFASHLVGSWWSEDPDDSAENDHAAAWGGVIYNIDRARRIMCITYTGDNTTLITSEEY